MATWLEVTIGDGELIHRVEREAPDWPAIPRVGDRIHAGSRGDDALSLEVERVRCTATTRSPSVAGGSGTRGC
jgi:hypothetical protein